MTEQPLPPGPAPASTASNRTVMIVLAYLWLLALVPLLVEKKTPRSSGMPSTASS